MSSNSDTNHVPLWELQEEHLDAVIFCAEDCPEDKNKAQELKEAIEGFSFDDGIRGKAAMYGESIQYGRSLVSSLDDALKFSTLLFGLYSKDLEEDGINLQATNSSLWHTVENKARSDTFIPVIWKDGAVLPAYARVRQPLDMRRDNWRMKLKRLINSHLKKRLDREKEQEDLRTRYADMFHRATNGASPNYNPSRHKFVPSENQDGPSDILCQQSQDNIDVHSNGVHPQDIDADNEKAPQFPWNIMRSLTSERGLCYLSVLGLVLVSLAVIKWKARRVVT